MNELLDKLKNTIRNIDKGVPSKGKHPDTILNKYILDQNNILLEAYIQAVNPYCTLVLSYPQSQKGNFYF